MRFLLYLFFKKPFLILKDLWLLKAIKATVNQDAPISFQVWFIQKVLGINRGIYWPIHHSSIVSYPNRVLIGIETNPGMNPGCYIHGVNRIYIGDYTQFGPNVGLMSGNHDLYDFRKQQSANPIRIGKHCWIGMGAVILPEVVLGDFTIVGAGAIVTKSFPDGKCVIAGNPARKIKDLEPENCKYFTTDNPYIGYMSVKEFELFKLKNLDV